MIHELDGRAFLIRWTGVLTTIHGRCCDSDDLRKADRKRLPNDSRSTIHFFCGYYTKS